MGWVSSLDLRLMKAVIAFAPDGTARLLLNPKLCLFMNWARVCHHNSNPYQKGFHTNALSFTGLGCTFCTEPINESLTPGIQAVAGHLQSRFLGIVRDPIDVR